MSLTDDGWRQAKLPVKHGGLGVLSASDIALPAFLASVFLNLRNIVVPMTSNTITMWTLWQSITMSPTPDASIAANQEIWSRPLQVIAAEASRARLIAAAALSSGAFL